LRAKNAFAVEASSLRELTTLSQTIIGNIGKGEEKGKKRRKGNTKGGKRREVWGEVKLV